MFALHRSATCAKRAWSRYASTPRAEALCCEGGARVPRSRLSLPSWPVEGRKQFGGDQYPVRRMIQTRPHGELDARSIGERSDAVLRTAIGERSDAVLRTAMRGQDGLC